MPFDHDDDMDTDKNVQKQDNSDIDGDGNGATKKLISSMLSSDAVYDLHHYHSFRPTSFVILPVHTCAGCGRRIQPTMWGPTRPLQCVACGCYSHRSCAFSKNIVWAKKCRVNFPKYHKTGSDVDGINDHAVEETSRQSIFRWRASSLLDIDDNPISLHSAASESDVLDDTLSCGAHVDDKIQNSRANFPFLSSVSLLRYKKTHFSSPAIQASKTWPEYACEHHVTAINTQYAPPQSQLNASHNSLSSPHKDQQFLWTQSGPISHWANELNIGEISAQAQHIRDLGKQQQQEENDSHDSQGPLHTTSGFRVVSRALHENIVATFGRFVATKQEEGVTTAKADDAVESEDSSDETTTRSESSVVTDQKWEVQGLLEEANPVSATTVDKKRLGIGYIAGGVAGGLAGLVLAGPAGGLIGIKAGQLGVLGLLLEGSLTVGALAGGVAAGQNIGKQIDDKIQESRVLALGEGTQRQVLLLIRPSIQQPDPIWETIFQDARKTYGDGGNNGLVRRLVPNEANVAKRERYEREVDIVQVEEAELATTDKVLLLVSRILNNKESLPGHVYRHLIRAFRERAKEDDKEDLHDQDPGSLSAGTTTDLINNTDTSIPTAPTKRRQDTHAVIKYITAALLETRPGFGSSPSMTEMTATAVESLVFGEVYALVMAEIENEMMPSDSKLLTKINEFDQYQEGKIFPSISEEALDALKCLPEAHSAVDKLRYCVVFLEAISANFSRKESQVTMGADALLPMVCQHILAAKVHNMNAQIAFLEEFARDEQLLRGREGYSLVTLQAALHYLNSSNNFENDIFGQAIDSKENNIGEGNDTSL